MEPSALHVGRHRPLPGSVAFLVLALLLATAPGRAAEPAAPPPAPNPPRVDAPKATVPVVIDGVLNEPVWAQATPLRVDYLDKKPGEPTDPPKMTVRVAWDDFYLYLGYEFLDANLQAAGTGETQGPPNNRREGVVADPSKTPDFVEFFISFGDPNFFWEVHHNAANQLSDIWCTVADPAWPLAKSSIHRWGIHFATQEFLQDDPPYTLAMAVHMLGTPDGRTSTVNDAADTDRGYSAELRLPWFALGTPRPWETRVKADPTRPHFTIPGPWQVAGKEVNLLTVLHNGDIPEMYFHSAPTRRGDWFHRSFPHWPVYRFVADTPPPAP